MERRLRDRRQRPLAGTIEPIGSRRPREASPREPPSRHDPRMPGRGYRRRPKPRPIGTMTSAPSGMPDAPAIAGTPNPSRRASRCARPKDRCSRRTPRSWPRAGQPNGEVDGARERRDRRRRRDRGSRGGRRRAPPRAPDAPLQDPGSDQAPPDHAGAGHQGGARQQGRGADHLSLARRALLRADAEHRRAAAACRARSPASPTAAGSRRSCDDLDVPEGMGVIVRTAGSERSKAEIKRDFEYLLRLWDEIRDLTLKSTAPALIYEEGNLIKRSIRDLYTRDIDEVLVDGEEGYQHRQGLHEDADAEPRQAREALSRSDRSPLFHRYPGRKPDRRDPFAGRCSCARAATSSSTRPRRWSRSTSIPAARRASATSRRPRSRPISRRPTRSRASCGCAIWPGSSSSTSSTWRSTATSARSSAGSRRRCKHDRARIQLGRISPFGLLEMSRQRLRPSLIEASTQPCPHCDGTGHIRSTESTALHVLRAIEEEGMRRRSAEICVAVPTKVALYILNQKRESLKQIEARYGFRVIVAQRRYADPAGLPAGAAARLWRRRGAAVARDPGASPGRGGGRRRRRREGWPRVPAAADEAVLRTGGRGRTRPPPPPPPPPPNRRAARGPAGRGSTAGRRAGRDSGRPARRRTRPRATRRRANARPRPSGGVVAAGGAAGGRDRGARRRAETAASGAPVAAETVEIVPFAEAERYRARGRDRCRRRSPGRSAAGIAAAELRALCRRQHRAAEPAEPADRRGARRSEQKPRRHRCRPLKPRRASRLPARPSGCSRKLGASPGGAARRAMHTAPAPVIAAGIEDDGAPGDRAAGKSAAGMVATADPIVSPVMTDAWRATAALPPRRANAATRPGPVRCFIIDADGGGGVRAALSGGLLRALALVASLAAAACGAHRARAHEGRAARP